MIFAKRFPTCDIQRGSDEPLATVSSGARAPRVEAPGSIWNWAPLVILIIASLLVCAAVSLRPRNSDRLVAIFPPWWSSGQSLTAASQVASVSGFGAFSFIVAVRGSQAGLESDLRGAGALFVIDGTPFAFCGTASKGIEKS